MKYDFFHFANFGVDQPFCYVVFEHLHNVDERASYLSLFCYRPVSLTLIAYCCNVDFKHLLVVAVAQLKVLTVPVAPVKNWRHPAGPPISFRLLFKK